MDPARPPVPAKDTGLPPGVRVGPLVRRFLAYVADLLVPAAAVTMVILARRDAGGASVALTAVAVLVALVWAFVCWQQLALRAASPGMRLFRLQLVGFFDGRPVRWGRVLLRWLVFTALSVTGIGLLLLVVAVLVSSRRQGWHDRAAGAVVIVKRPLAPRRTTVPTSRTTLPSATEVTPVPEPVLEPAPAPASASPAAEEHSPAAVAQAPAPVPGAVAGDPAVGPELAPVAADPPIVGAAGSSALAGQPAANGHRTILEGWVAELDDGREIAVRGLVLLGRNPQPSAGEDDAELVKLPDESRTVSKTHLALGVDDAGLFVVDRGSTNGSTITAPGRPAQPAGPFHAVSVSAGSVVSIGDHWVRIRRDAD